MTLRLGRRNGAGLAQGGPHNTGLPQDGSHGAGLARAGRSAALFALCLVPFITLATFNSGGYRYGASDQAFYVPAVLQQLDPSLFPRDAALLGAQTRLTAVDEVLALIARAAGTSLPFAFALLYVVGLMVLAAGAWMIGRYCYRSPWTAAALLAALTLRHAIARSGTNTLEGYFHPRMLAYGLGACAIAAFLRGRLTGTAVLLALGAAVHPTTALWFGAWLLVAAAITYERVRMPAAIMILVGAAGALWALTAGPLAGRLAPMDDEWRRLLASKDYLFPLEWPAYPWIVNLAYLPIIALAFRRRQHAGLTSGTERGLVLGSTVLLIIFVAGLVGHAFGIAFAFQLQPARIFWMFDFMAVVYVVWWLAEGRAAPAMNIVPSWRPVLTAVALAAISLARGAYVVLEARRPPVQLSIADNDWGRVMAWARTTDPGSHFLADPLHAVRYGTSVRVAGHRDVVVEAVKDAAIGMYAREVAIRTDERLRAIGDYGAIDAARARDLARTYDIDYMITQGPLDLPLAFESGAIRVYRLQ